MWRFRKVKDFNFNFNTVGLNMLRLLTPTEFADSATIHVNVHNKDMRMLLDALGWRRRGDLNQIADGLHNEEIDRELERKTIDATLDTPLVWNESMFCPYCGYGEENCTCPPEYGATL